MSKSLLTSVTLVAILVSRGPAEVQVNIRTSGAQANAAIAASPGGGAIVVWGSYYTTSGRSNDILARRLDPNGAFGDGEFQVNAIGEGNQTEPAVATSGGGAIGVAWQGPGLDGEDIFLRLLDPNEAPTTDDLLVTVDGAGRQLYPSLAGSAGAFVVAWESRETTPDGDRTLVCAQLFDPNGAGLGGRILVEEPFCDGRYADVALDAAGNFAVTWLRETGADTVMVRRFDPNGVPIGAPLEVSTAGIASVTRPSIAMNPLGAFVIAWDGDPNRASDDDIHARLFDPNGVPRGEPFVVNTIREGAQQWPRAAISDAGEFVIVWESAGEDPNTAPEIFARRFDPNGLPAGEEFQLNLHTPDKQRYPDVTMAGADSFVAVWESSGQDGSGYGIFAHIESPAATDPNEPALTVDE